MLPLWSTPERSITNAMKERVIFEEVQSFVGTWIWYLVITISVLVIGSRIAAATLSSTSSDGGFVGLMLAVIALGGVIALLATSRLYVTIDKNNIYYRFPPFVSKEKHLGQGDIREMQVRKYRPIREYGGYGYRFRFRSGRAMNVSGNMGLQLVLTNGKKLLIGTQKPESMQTAIRHLKENWGMNG